MDKKAIFLLPLDLKGKKQTRITPKFIRDVYSTKKPTILPEHLQKKKKNIFTVELNRLIGKISEKNNSPSPEELISKEEKTEELKEAKSQNSETLVSPEIDRQWTPPEITEQEKILNRIYSDDSSIENANHFLQNIFSGLGVKAYSLFFYEPHTFTYFPVLTKGLSEKAKTNLLFQSQDKFLQNNSTGYIHLYFQPVLINDIFFKKKLTAFEFANYASLVLKFLDIHKLPGLIAIFFDKNSSKSKEDITRLSQAIDAQIEPLVPFLNSYFEKEISARLDSYDFLRNIVHSIRIQSRKLKSEFYFTKIEITNYLKIEDSLAKKKSLILNIQNHLLPEESVINISFNEFIILSKENEVIKIINYISENSSTEFEFHFEALKYPNNGKNLYLYF